MRLGIGGDRLCRAVSCRLWLHGEVDYDAAALFAPKLWSTPPPSWLQGQATPIGPVHSLLHSYSPVSGAGETTEGCRTLYYACVLAVLSDSVGVRASELWPDIGFELPHGGWRSLFQF